MVKFPKSAPMFAAPGKLTEVGVNQSVPSMEKFPEMVAADATPQRLSGNCCRNCNQKVFLHIRNPRTWIFKTRYIWLDL